MHTHLDLHMNLLDQIYNFTLLNILIPDWRPKRGHQEPKTCWKKGTGAQYSC